MTSPSSHPGQRTRYYTGAIPQTNDNELFFNRTVAVVAGGKNDTSLVC
jgi:hypothetical protein